MRALTFHWRLYRRLVGAQIRSQTQYRASFLFDFASQFVGNIVDFAVVLVLFTQFPAIGGWSLGEVGLLYGLSSVNYYPTLWLLDKPDPLGLPAWLAFLSPVVCLLVFAVGVRMWWFGVQKYTSTGS